jgi:hypothetical protein
MSMICEDCHGLLPLKRELAVLHFKLPARCVPCASKDTTKPRPADVPGIAVGGDYDETLTHFRERQGLL